MVKILTVHLSPSEKNIIDECEIRENNINTIKELRTHLKIEESESVGIMFQNSLLSDLTEIEELGEYPEIFICNDIETKKIDTSDLNTFDTQGNLSVSLNANFEIEDSSSRVSSEVTCKRGGRLVKIKVDGEAKEVDESEIFVKDGNSYLIVKKTKKMPFKNHFAKITSSISRETLSQLVLLSMIFLTENLVLMTIVVFLRIFTNISNIVTNSKLYKVSESNLFKKIFMFFASLLIIDHDRLHLDRSV